MTSNAYCCREYPSTVCSLAPVPYLHHDDLVMLLEDLCHRSPVDSRSRVAMVRENRFTLSACLVPNLGTVYHCFRHGCILIGSVPFSNDGLARIGGRGDSGLFFEADGNTIVGSNESPAPISWCHTSEVLCSAVNAANPAFTRPRSLSSDG